MDPRYAGHVPLLGPGAAGSGSVAGRCRGHARGGDRRAPDRGAELVDWAFAFGMGQLLRGLPESLARFAEIEHAWAEELAQAAEAHRQPDGWVRLGRRTRILLGR